MYKIRTGLLLMFLAIFYVALERQGSLTILMTCIVLLAAGCDDLVKLEQEQEQEQE